MILKYNKRFSNILNSFQQKGFIIFYFNASSFLVILLPISLIYNYIGYSGSNNDQMLSGIGFVWPLLMIASSAFQAGASILKVQH